MIGGLRAGRRLLPALLFGLLPSLAHAQHWTVDVSAGRAVSDPIFERIGGATASLGLRYEGDAKRWLYLSGGIDTRRNGPAWGAGGAGVWLGREREGFALGAHLGAHLFGYSETEDFLGGAGTTLEAFPTLLLRRERLRVELRTGVVQVVTRSGPQTLARNAFDGGASASVELLAGLRVGAEGRYVVVPEGDRPYLGGTAALDHGPLAAWAFAGRWYANDVQIAPYTGYGAGGTLSLPSRLEISAGWQQEPGDPLFRSSPRRSWVVRMSRAFGGRRADPSAAPLAPPEPADGRVTLRLPVAEHPEAPSVLGDFTGWQPAPMVRAGDFWVLRLEVAPGVHHYGFRTPDGRWFVPESYPQVDDGMGGTSAVLVVPGA